MIEKLSQAEEAILKKKLLSRRRGMLTRCYNKNSAKYVNYGARGVTVCQRWRDSKELFLHDVKQLSGYDAEAIVEGGKLQLDKDIRVPGSMHYGPDTCSWVTPSQNVQVKPSYMWWHYAYNLETNTLVKFYSVNHFCKTYDLSPKSVSTVTHSENKRQNNTGWLNGWYFWSKGAELDRTMKLFVATTPEGTRVSDYKVGRLADTLGIPRNEAYKLTSPAKTKYTEYHGYTINTKMLSKADLEPTANKVSPIK